MQTGAGAALDPYRPNEAVARGTPQEKDELKLLLNSSSTYRGADHPNTRPNGGFSQ